MSICYYTNNEAVTHCFGKSKPMPILGALIGFSLLLGTATLPMGGAAAQSTATPVAPAAPSYTVAMTAYNAVPGQTDETPFETASGAYSNPEIVAARSQDMSNELPFGTIIEIDGSNLSPSDDNCGYSAVNKSIGYRVIEDSMNVKFTKRVDILFDTKLNYTSPNGNTRNYADVMGICKGTTVRVVGYVDINHLPKTQAELAALVKKQQSTLALNK